MLETNITYSVANMKDNLKFKLLPLIKISYDYSYNETDQEDKRSFYQSLY